MRLFLEHGFENVSINEICRESNQHKQSVYNYFGDLDGIQLAAIKMYNETVMAPAWPEYEKLNNFFEKLNLRLTNTIEKKYLSSIKIKPVNGCLFQKMYISRNSLENKTKKFIIAIESTTINKLVSWIKDAKAKNQISKKIKPIETARIIQSMHRSLDVLSGGPLNRKELIDTKDEFLNLLKLS
jgi:AcrR family transcriptional regulator